jgi:hypothetical protein
VISALRGAAGLDSNRWPPEGTRDVWEEIDFYSALRDSDVAQLRANASALGMSGTHPSYLHLPIPRLISRVKANLLYGEAPRVTPAAEQDRSTLDDLIDENDLTSELHRAALIASSEGEVWGKVTVAPKVLSVPIVEFVSRRQVLPRFAGRFVVGATFVKEIREGPTARTVWRTLEDHTAGLIQTRLYQGDDTHLGTQMPLTSRPETADLLGGTDDIGNTVAVVQTGIEQPLCVFIPNTIDTDPTRGVSDYLGVEAAFFAINEAATTGQANVRLTARKRLFVKGLYLNSRGNLPNDQDVFRSDEQITENGAQGGPVTVAQYTFESAELIAWQNHIIDLVLTLAGVSPQSVGRFAAGQGSTTSGTALKLRMTHTLMEAAGTGRYFDRGTRKLLRLAQLLDAFEFRRAWRSPTELPSIERGDGLPQDTIELAQELQALSSASAISTEQMVRRQHPDWTDEQVQAEVTAIEGANTPPPTPGAGVVQTGRESIPTAPPAVVLGAGGST